MNYKLDEIVNTHAMDCAIAVDSKGNVVGQSREESNILNTSIASSLLGPYGNPKDAFNSLEGMILPQVQRQGELLAFIDRPQENIMIIVFGKSDLSAKEIYQLSKEVSKTINDYDW